MLGRLKTGNPLSSVGEDVVVLAGDIDHAEDGVAWAAEAFDAPIVILPGNHEAYGEEIGDVRARMRREVDRLNVSRAFPIHLLDRDVAIIGGVRFVGCILWTDYRLYGRAAEAMIAAHQMLNDHSLIRVGAPITRRFSPEDAQNENKKDLAFLVKALEEPFDGPTVVVTHHLPSPACVSEKYASSPLNPAFASDLDWLMEATKPTLWIHGHTHDTVDVHVAQTRILCNPRGYWPRDLNPEFNPEKTIEIENKPRLDPSNSPT
jgi:hypothetical protein